MINIVDNKKNNPTNVKVKAIPFGQVFRGRIGGTDGLFLRGYNVFVLLSDPESTWTDSIKDVDAYEPVDVQITVL